MSQSLFSKLSDEITAPTVGTISVLVANTTAQIIDLGSLGNQSLDMRNADALPVAGDYASPGSATIANQGQSQGGVIGRFVEFYCDSIDVGLIFGANAAVLGGANAASLSAVGTNGAGCCARVPGASFRTYFVHPAARFMSYIAANTTSNIRIMATSRTG
jgi:hypothetical protein